MKDVCSPINKPRDGQAGDPGKLVKVKHTAVYGSRNDAGASKPSPPPRTLAQLADPDPHPAASRTGGTTSVAWDTRK
jgi:hypothetical protein